MLPPAVLPGMLAVRPVETGPGWPDFRGKRGEGLHQRKGERTFTVEIPRRDRKEEPAWKDST